MGYLYDLWDDFISMLFPRLCPGCGNHLLRNETTICSECYILIPRTNYHLEPDNPVAQLFWGRCVVDQAAAFSFYTRDSRIRKLIHQLKYKGMPEIGYELGRIYGSSLKNSEFIRGIDIIIPVPLHKSKKRKRGFNQSELVCNGISDATGLKTDPTLLVRKSMTGTQTTRSRYDRWTNVEGIFSITDPERLNNMNILVVDDVITTGSTIEACVNELSKAENVKIKVAALAFAAI
jgi:ComF family protein